MAKSDAMKPALTLVLETSTAACTVALFDADDLLLGCSDAVIGRGHAEHLVPMIGDLMAGRSASTVLVGCGPGSFTGLRVGIAAAHGLAIGWDAQLLGMSSLALIAASATGDEPLAVAVTGGHGELFVQQFTRLPLVAVGALLNLSPIAVAAKVQVPLLVGSGAQMLAEVSGPCAAYDLLPRAAAAMTLPAAFRTLHPRPIYARPADAMPRAA